MTLTLTTSRWTDLHLVPLFIAAHALVHLVY